MSRAITSFLILQRILFNRPYTQVRCPLINFTVKSITYAKITRIHKISGLDDLKVTEGANLLSLYQFNTFTAKHYFCSVCGIYTHHQRRSNPQEYGFNVACLEGVSPYDFENIPILDGVNHSCDLKSD